MDEECLLNYRHGGMELRNTGEFDSCISEPENPYDYMDRFHVKSWKPFDDSNVYFDECVAHIGNQIKQYNRIAVIIQGLFDRSKILHPHPPVKLWVPEEFQKSVKLVYNNSNVLHYGEAPDFDACFNACNEILDGDSVVIGQEDIWGLKEGKKETERRYNSWKELDRDDVERYRPHGNLGPGYIAKIDKWQSKAKKSYI